jgi:hypothetical protein
MSQEAELKCFVLPADGIEAEVIHADIGIYLGDDAQVALDQVSIIE